jgi:GntR family transcriptional regulator/MocR family aminotransferase
MSQVLRAQGARVAAVESYGLPEHRNQFTKAGLRTVPLPIDKLGIDPSGLPELGAQVALLTPAHQFPTGNPLPAGRRAAVIDWARRTGGVVLEDDYDGEFRYDRQPIGALQGLDPDRVVYLGTASKSLSPALRLGWMLLPEGLVWEVQEAKGIGEWTNSALDQLALAEFIDSGGYDKHVRAMRQRYRLRRDRLVAALAERAPHVKVTGIAAGLHALLELPPGTELSVVHQRAARESLALSDLARLTYAPPAEPRSAVIVGYATPPDHLFPGALAALCRALAPV